MTAIRTVKALSTLALALSAAGTLLLSAPAAHAGEYLDTCLDSVGARTSPNGVWKIPARNYSQGSSGVCVKEIQADLASTIGLDLADADGFIDGRFGPKTDAYVRRFQQTYHLQADGVVGPQTWQMLVSMTKD
ncbi:peptidoglycan-binding domain-containing protein [Streptomyces sp. NPDC049099]|uniref:peptidoglycan-binding domain-containing protein n=1 Tax=unclassified Streptomyces TaxID=2593676 RepID=UPI003443C3E4